MLAIAWNCQGLGNPLTVQNLVNLCIHHRPNLICLSETKAKSKKILKLNRKLGYQYVKYIESEGISGGMCILWDDSLDVNLVEVSQDFIDGVIKEANGQRVWRFTFVYGNPDFDSRQGKWQRLIASCVNMNLPRLCFGDFNDILSHSEKEGDRLKEARKIRGFKHCVDSFSFVELESKGCFYTWANNRFSGKLVKEKLDRVFSNPAWLLLHPNVSVIALPPIGSDHSPLLINTEVCPERGLKPFRLDDVDFPRVVGDAWKVNYDGSFMLIFHNKLCHCKSKLLLWSRSKFQNGATSLK